VLDLAHNSSQDSLGQGENLAKEINSSMHKRFFNVMPRTLNLTSTILISKAELSTLFVELVLALEKNETQNTETLCKVVKEYLLYSEEIEYKKETLLIMNVDAPTDITGIEGSNLSTDITKNVLSILSNSNKVEDPGFMLLYEQSSKSLKLGLHFEDTLNKLIKYVETNGFDSENRNRNEIFYYSPEYDENFSIQKAVSVFDKITDSWRLKSKATTIKVLKGGELVSMKDTKDDVDLNKMKNFSSSLRFGTLGSDPYKNTSLGARNPIAPKQPTQSIKADNSKNNNNNSFEKSTYTKIEVNPNAAFLAPTESLKHKNDVSVRKTQQDIDREFMLSMRSHRTISSKKILKRNNLNKTTKNM
jgi:hypothetical protein